MGRRTRIQVAEQQRSLDDLVARADGELDEARRESVQTLDRARFAGELARAAGASAFMVQGILVPLYDFATEHARADSDRRRPGSPRRRRDPSARWRDEIEVIRFLARAGAPTMRARVAVGGETGKALDRASSGSSSGGARATSTARYEPRFDDHHAAAHAAWIAIAADDRLRLVLAYASLGAGEQIGAASIAARIRDGERSIPSGLVVEAKHVTAALLIAREEGRIASMQPPELQIEIAATVAGELATARRAFRDRLRAVELDIAPALLIPRPSLRERERDEAVITRCCVGDVVIRDGARLPCVLADLVVDAASWPRCDACGRPRRARPDG